jgi:hypothetical protein
MTEFDTVFDDPLSVMVFSTITIGFIVAHALATVWVTGHEKNTDLAAPKPA